MKQESKIYSYLLSLLAGKDYSEKKLREKLHKKGFSEEQVRDVLHWAIEKKYWSEDRYLEQRIKILGQRGHGVHVISLKLKEENLRPSDDFIKNVLEEWGITTHSQIWSLIEKSLSQKKISKEEEFNLSEKERLKILRNIISKGHSYDMVSEKLDTYLQSSIF